MGFKPVFDKLAYPKLALNSTIVQKFVLISCALEKSEPPIQREGILYELGGSTFGRMSIDISY